MKKIIESDLISIAHRILKLKDKSDIQTLLKETELLHNKLILLQFYEDNKFRLDPSITEEKLFEQLKEQEPKETEPVKAELNNYMSADIVNDLLEDSKNDDVVTFEEEIVTPIELNVSTSEEIEESVPEDSVTPVKETETKETETKETETKDEAREVVFTPSIEETQKTVEEIDRQIEEIEENDPVEDAKEALERVTLEIDPVFSIAHDKLFDETTVPKNNDDQKVGAAPQHFVTNQHEAQPAGTYRQAPLNKTINDAFAHKISIGLNDRIAFEKNLFNGNGDDLNRVIAQLNTIETFQEAQDFIEDLVKPEFNNWQGREDYEKRFMALVEKRFL